MFKPGRVVCSDHATGMDPAYSPGEPIDYSPAVTVRGAMLRITRAWMTEDGWPNEV